MTAGYSHLDAGTPEEVWREELARRALRPLDTPLDVLVVVAAHPDDETLGAAGLMARAAAAGGRVVVVVVSDGEASHPESPTHSPEELARRRRLETEQAVTTVAATADVRFLGLPDGRLAERAEDIRERLSALLDSLRTLDAHAAVLASPWAGDRHRDHRVVAEITGQIAARRGLRHFAYPIWTWHWGTPADVPWDRTVGLQLSDDEIEAKRRAVACHVSQIEPLSPQRGDEAMLHEGMREHFLRDVEVFIVERGDSPTGESLDAGWFDDFYRRNGDDPWGFETRWYEERKRALTLAALPTRDLGMVLELGCATGLLTAALAARARRVVAVEAAAAAVKLARARLAGDPRVSVIEGAVPETWPAGRFDTIVLSEIGYYFSPPDLQRTIERIDGALTDSGSLIACHWRHPVAEYPQTGDEVHDALRSVEAWETVSLHEERDFVLEVFQRRPARSVAEAEGLV